MDTVREYFKRDRLAIHLNMEIVSVSPGEAVIRMPIQDYHLNSLDMVHGGAMFALADFAFAVASNSHGTTAVGVNASMAFMKAARGKVLTARARELNCGAKLATYVVEVLDEDETLIGSFQGMVYRKRDPLPIHAEAATPETPA
jgi:acyl-CoA thioesterase